MKLKATIGLVALGLLGASIAYAAPPPGKGNPHSTTSTTSPAAPTETHGKKPSKTGPGCKPAVAVILRGTLTANGTASAITLTVTGGNSFGAAYKKATKPVGVAVTSSTKVMREKKVAATDLKSGDSVVVQARACKADVAGGKTPALTATRVTAHPAS